MTSTAIVHANADTGEVTRIEAFDPTAYLASLSVDTQRKMAAAYDAACAALIGPNDVQQESGRSFKKKSAWRKLARHFGISTSVATVERAYLGDTFIATVTVRATAPWGQHSDAVGACATDEATGRRVITLADAIATAETRATNRAVSNLIAMGEVSAEEIGDRPARSSAPRGGSVTGTASIGGATGATMPFGKTKGRLLADLDEGEIRGALTWAEGKGKFTEFQADARAELARRAGGVATREPGEDDDLFLDEPHPGA